MPEENPATENPKNKLLGLAGVPPALLKHDKPPRSEEWCDANDRWLTAVHEAGHAVAAHHHGLIIEMMRLRKDRAINSNGYVVPARSQSGVRFAKERIALLLAGNIAVNIETRAEIWWRNGGDETKALRTIFEVLGEGDEDFWDLEDNVQKQNAVTYRNECFRTTILLLRRPAIWRTAQSLAQTLFWRGVLRLPQLSVLLCRLSRSAAGIAPVRGARWLLHPRPNPRTINAQ